MSSQPSSESCRGRYLSPLQTQPQPRARRIPPLFPARFAPTSDALFTVHAGAVPGLWEHSPSDVRTRWYTNDDSPRMEADVLRSVRAARRLAREGNPQQGGMGESEHGGRRRRGGGGGEETAADEEEECIRGFEHMRSATALMQQKERKNAVIEAVLLEQRRQRVNAADAVGRLFTDEDIAASWRSIAEASASRSRWASDVALTMGASDEAYVRRMVLAEARAAASALEVTREKPLPRRLEKAMALEATVFEEEEEDHKEGMKKDGVEEKREQVGCLKQRSETPLPTPSSSMHKAVAMSAAVGEGSGGSKSKGSKNACGSDVCLCVLKEALHVNKDDNKDKVQDENADSKSLSGGPPRRRSSPTLRDALRSNRSSSTSKESSDMSSECDKAAGGVATLASPATALESVDDLFRIEFNAIVRAKSGSASDDVPPSPPSSRVAATGNGGRSGSIGDVIKNASEIIGLRRSVSLPTQQAPAAGGGGEAGVGAVVDQITTATD